MASTGFVDVTSGSNDLYNVGEYSAGVGYDEASGLGSPNGAGFFAGLCPPKFDATKSSFAVSSSSAPVNTPINVTATLRNTDNDPLANALVNVTATNESGKGQVLIDADHASASSNGSASYSVATNASGVAQFSVTGSAAGSIDVVTSYESQTIDAVTIDVTAAAKVTTKVPGRATIEKLTSLVGGFDLVVRAPSSNGGAAISAYQYSLNGGSKWISLSPRTTSIKVAHLAKGTSYRVVVRALNVNGAGAASAAKSIVTRK
jgi:titin